MISGRAICRGRERPAAREQYHELGKDMRICFIVNPVAGRGRSLKAMEAAGEVLDQTGHTYHIHRSSRPREATSLAAQAAGEGMDLVVAVGGDGTVCEVGRGLIRTNTALGVIPAGTGNDYCRCLGIPQDPTEAAKLLLTGRARPVDAMRAGDVVGLNISSVGFDVEVVRRSRRFLWLGKLSYVAGVFSALLSFKGISLELDMDGERREGAYFLLAAGKGTDYGGGMRVLPNARVDSGMLDVCLVEPAGLWTVLRFLPSFIKGRHVGNKIVHMGRVRRVEIISPGAMTLNVDGEIVQAGERVVLEVLPRALQVIAPADL